MLMVGDNAEEESKSDILIFLLFIMQAKLAGRFQCLEIFAAIAS